jgi:hypothetical protein
MQHPSITTFTLTETIADEQFKLAFATSCPEYQVIVFALFAFCYLTKPNDIPAFLS